MSQTKLLYAQSFAEEFNRRLQDQPQIRHQKSQGHLGSTQKIMHRRLSQNKSLTREATMDIIMRGSQQKLPLTMKSVDFGKKCYPKESQMEWMKDHIQVKNLLQTSPDKFTYDKVDPSKDVSPKILKQKKIFQVENQAFKKILDEKYAQLNYKYIKNRNLNASNESPFKERPQTQIQERGPELLTERKCFEESSFVQKLQKRFKDKSKIRKRLVSMINNSSNEQKAELYQRLQGMIKK